MTNISDLIANGYTAVDILSSLFGKQPKNMAKMRKLMQHGYSASSILQHLLGDTSAPEEKYMTSAERARASQEGIAKRNLSALLSVGTLAAGLGAAGLAGRGLTAGMQAAETARKGMAAGSALADVAQNIAGEQAEAMQEPQEGGVTLQQQRAAKALQAAREAREAPLSRQAIMQQAEEMQAPEEMQRPIAAATEDVLKQFPAAKALAQKLMSSGKTIDEAYNLMKKSKLNKPAMDMYERTTGTSFKEYLSSLRKASPKQLINDRKAVLENTAAMLELLKKMKNG